jgi:hypothetical protein
LGNVLYGWHDGVSWAGSWYCNPKANDYDYRRDVRVSEYGMGLAGWVLSRRRDSMEKLLVIVLAVSMVAFCALILTGCLVGIYALIGFVL